MGEVRLTVAGHPRSGNVWLARLLGDALDVPVVGIRYGRDSLAAEGQSRPNPGYVRQAHLWPTSRDHHLGVRLTPQNQGEFLLIVRDPRDVAVSAAAYWGWTLDEALDKLIEGPGPLELPPWTEYVKSWLCRHVPILRYEDLHEDAEREVGRLLEHLGLPAQKPLAEVMARQSFAVKRHEMRRRGHLYPFGRGAQLQHLRKGETGEWREVMSADQKRKALLAWGRTLTRLGYDTNGV